MTAPAAAELVDGAPAAPRSSGRVFLLGPQTREATLDRILREAGVDGPVAVVSSGWEEREEELDELGQLGGRDRNLGLFGRAERMYRRIPELDDLRQEHLRRRRQVRRLYGLRLQHIFDTWEALGQRHEEPGLVHEQQASLMQELRRLDAEHLERIDTLVQQYAEILNGAHGEPLLRQRRKVAGIVNDCAAVVVAGGNVSTLQETLELFALGALLEGKVVVGWSAGAMVLTDRLVLYHDHPPQGVGNPEVLCRGLGLVEGLVAMPHAGARLDLHDQGRVARLAARFAPADCVTLDDGAVLQHDGGTWRTERAGLMRADGSLQEPGW